MAIENDETGEVLLDKEVLVIRLEDFENAGVTSKNWSALHEFTDDQINACYDWLEEVPAEGSDESDTASREEWRAAAPKFIRFTGEIKPATDEQPAMELIEFVLEESDAKKLKRLETWKKKTEEAEVAVRDQATKVLALKSKVDEAKADHKAATERWEQLVCVLQQVITDAKSGQQELPFPDDGAAATGAETTAAAGDPDWSLTCLSQKEIATYVGADIVESQKAQEDPIGLSETQLDKLEAACESATVVGLEKWIAADAWWHKKISGFGEKAITRVVSTLTAFRRAKPMAVVE